jgi:hypothetical protein
MSHRAERLRTLFVPPLTIVRSALGRLRPLALLFVTAPLACARGGAAADLAAGPAPDGGAAPLDSSTSAETDGETDGDGDASVQAACAARETAYCGQLARCAPFLISTQYGDTAACLAQRTAVCLDAVGAPGSGWTTGGLQACSQALAALSCSDFLRPKPAPNVCRVSGLTDTGAACRYDAQCRSGYCRVESGAGCGRCVTLGLTGAPCSTFADCDGDLVCTMSGMCEPPAGVGVACDGARPCRLGLACTTGTCIVAGSAGTVCDPHGGGGDCDGDQGLVCNALTSRCTALGVVPIGQSCGSGSAACYGGGACENGSCVAAPQIGDACGIGPAGGCGPLGTCTGGVCQPLTAADCQ